jgi:hypothetical protein
VPIYFKKLVTRAREIRRNKQKRAVSVFPDLRSLLTSLLQAGAVLSGTSELEWSGLNFLFLR